MLKTDLYSAIKSKDSEALYSGTSQLGSQRAFGGRETLVTVLPNDANHAITTHL